MNQCAVSTFGITTELRQRCIKMTVKEETMTEEKLAYKLHEAYDTISLPRIKVAILKHCLNGQ